MRAVHGAIFSVVACASIAACTADVVATRPAPRESAPLDADPTSAFGGPVPAACTGARLDLTAIDACRCTRTLRSVVDGRAFVRAAAWCGEAFDAPLDPAIEISLHAEPDHVAAGRELTLVFTIRNRAAASRAVRFDGRSLVRQVDVFDAEGRDVTRTGSCGQGSSASYDDHLVVLAAGGEATVRVTFSASSHHGEMEDGACRLERRPYPPGRYRVVARTALAGADAEVAAPSTFVDVR